MPAKKRTFEEIMKEREELDEKYWKRSEELTTEVEKYFEDESN